MRGSVNRVILLGQISRSGIEVRYSPSGSPCASFVLVLPEVGQDRREHVTLIPCEVWGKKAETVGELDAGVLVLFEGRLQKRRKDGGWELYVSGWEVTPILTPVAVSA